MPRFSHQEKEIISVKLLAEGEKLFAMYGLKKVTVDDLVAAVNISKRSFYEFYPSKSTPACASLRSGEFPNVKRNQNITLLK